jgi:hypothetical protein
MSYRVLETATLRLRQLSPHRWTNFTDILWLVVSSLHSGYDLHLDQCAERNDLDHLRYLVLASGL